MVCGALPHTRGFYELCLIALPLMRICCVLQDACEKCTTVMVHCICTVFALLVCFSEGEISENFQEFSHTETLSILVLYSVLVFSFSLLNSFIIL